MSLYGANDSDFKLVPYTKLAPCERNLKGISTALTFVAMEPHGFDKLNSS